MKKPHSEWLKLLTQCADLADDISRHYYFRKDISIEQKKDKTFVTEADLEIERKIREFVAASDLELAVHGEEYGSERREGVPTLIVDPIDGTQNFIRRMPFFGSLLAVEVGTEIVAGHVSSPISQERWWASKGDGAFHIHPLQEQTRLKVSSISDPDSLQGLHGSLYGSEARGSVTRNVLDLLSKTKRQRGFGDFYSQVLVAQGCGEFAMDFALNVWDIAPLKILVEEAGGKVTDAEGNDSIYNGSIVSSNGLIHEWVISHLTA